VPSLEDARSTSSISLRAPINFAIILMLWFVSHSETTLFGVRILFEVSGLLNQLYWEHRVRSIYERATPFTCGCAER